MGRWGSFALFRATNRPLGKPLKATASGPAGDGNGTQQLPAKGIQDSGGSQGNRSRASSGGPSDNSTRHPQGAEDGGGDEDRDNDGSGSVAKTDSSLCKAMGGIEFGIAAVQLFADSNGRANSQGRGFIWVCNLDSRRAVGNSLVQSLKSKEAALYTDVFMKIGCRQGCPPMVTDCADPVSEEPTFLSTKTVLKRFLR